MEEAPQYNGRSPDRRRPAGPSDSTLRIYDLLAGRPEGLTLDEATEHLALGFPTDQYRAYAKSLDSTRNRRRKVSDQSATITRPGPRLLVYGSPEFQRRAKRWHALRVLDDMVKAGSARRSGGQRASAARWFAGRSPRVFVDGRRVEYVPGADTTKTAEAIRAINTIAVLRRIQRRLKDRGDIDAIDDAIKHYRRENCRE